jgi:hypothetical protein
MRKLIIVPLLTAASAWGACEVTKIDANRAKGFEWPYYLGVPNLMVQPAFLLVEPNNTGTASDNQALHDSAARNLLNSRCQDRYVGTLGSPILVPAFPRPAANPLVYTHALDRDTLLTKLPGLERLDLQLIAMIDDARERLAQRGIQVDRRAFLYGFSASGSFVNRFLMLHPDRVKAAFCGAGGSYAIVPVAEWKGKKLRYPVGIADLQELVGAPFDWAAFRTVPALFYYGDQDLDDALNYSDGYDKQDADLIRELFGGPPGFLRWPKVEAVYNSLLSACQFLVYPGAAHTPAPFWPQIWEFFDRNRWDPPPAPLPKPLLYKFYVPHVAMSDGWDTSLTLLNRSEAPVSGQVTAYAARGVDPLKSVPVTLAPGGRRDLAAAREFAGVPGVSHLAFESDSGFVNCQAALTGMGLRVPMILSRGDTSGEVFNTAGPNWSALTLINAGAQPAWVKLTAYADDGAEAASSWVYLRPQEKAAGAISELLQADMKNARRIYYSSKQRVVVFALGAAPDGKTLENLPGLPQYARQ